MQTITDIEQNVRTFAVPFAYILLNKEVEKYCSSCLRQPKCGKLSVCSGCHWSRYCGKDCQRFAWKDHHNKECKRLQKSYPNLPLTELLYISRIWHRLQFVQVNGDKMGWEKERRFSDLMSHKDDIRQDEARMTKFQKVYSRLLHFLGDCENVPSEEQCLEIYCKILINSHSLHDSSGTEIGMAIDMGISRFDHSCRPNCAMVFDGFVTTLRPLVHGVKTSDHQKVFISYIDIGQSKFQRRKQLQEKWYFWCECERCKDPEDDRLTAIKCPNFDNGCKKPLVITEVSDPTGQACLTCHTPVPEDSVKMAQDLMLQLFVQTKLTESPQVLKDLLESAQTVLHPENVYYCRLLTAYSQVCGASDETIADTKLQMSVYNNFKRCFPAADRHLGYQMLHLVKTLIGQKQRDEAARYAYEAMAIFEICFGFDHPYYLQTLALWTFLDTKTQKTDQELLSLLDFSYNKPIELSSVLDNSLKL